MKNIRKCNNNNNVIMKATLMAILAAALYGISSPLSKLLLHEIHPTFMAALLYLGAGFGMFVVNMIKQLKGNEYKEAKITRKDFPYVVGMILLDIGAPILLMIGLTQAAPANVSLLNNFEIVATTLIALLVFKEAIGKRMWFAILLITLSSMILTVKDYSSFSFSSGSAFVLIACICWGFENNCTRMLSVKDPFQIVVVKGFGSGIGALLISVACHQFGSSIKYILLTLLLGFVAYGLSIYFYVKAQRDLGASRTSSFYAMAPFIGVVVSWIIFREGIKLQFFIALIVMLIGVYFAISEVHNHQHLHQPLTHEHKHNHDDSHHNHTHTPDILGEHNHIHSHETVEHNHNHTPDIHHNHKHKKSSLLS